MPGDSDEDGAISLSACSKFKRDITRQGCLGVVSDSEKVGLVPAEEENEGEGGSSVGSETESTIIGDLPETPTASMAKTWAKFLPAEELMTGVSLFDVSVVLQGNLTPALTASRAAATHESIRGLVWFG